VCSRCPVAILPGIMVTGTSVKPARKSSSRATCSPASTKQDKTAAKKKEVDKKEVNKLQIPSCTGCGILISDDTRALMCDRCQAPGAWKCCACLNLPNEVYDVLIGATCSSLLYLCDECQSTTMKKQDSSMEDFRKMLEKMLEKIEGIEQTVGAKADNAAVVQLEKRLQSLEEKLPGPCHSEEAEHGLPKCKINEVVALLSDKCDEWKNHITNDVVLEQIHSKLTEDELEKEEQEKRRNSVIVFGLQESSSSDAEVRVAEDVEKMQEVLNVLDLQQEPDISKVIRLGKRAETAEERPRPLKVVLPAEDAKQEILKKAKNLKDKKEGGLNTIFIYADLTPKQREVRKKLVAELKSRQANGETGLIIVGSKIVKKRSY